MLKAALAAICVFTALAAGYLSVSVLILRPTRANDAAWFSVAALIVAAGASILAAIVNPQPWLRSSALAFGIVLGAVGVWMSMKTITSAHFEGYALVLGAANTLEGVLTLVVLSASRDHAMG